MMTNATKKLIRWAMALLVLVAGLLAIPTTANADGPWYQVVNTGGIGVRFRNSPNFNDIKGPGPYEGASFELLCMGSGEAVGEYSNTTWDYIRWEGQEGWIPDTYTDTPINANEFLPGVPMCADYFNPATQPEPVVYVEDLGPWTCNSGNIKTVALEHMPGGHWKFIVDPTTSARWGFDPDGIWNDMWACMPYAPSLPDQNAVESVWQQLLCHWTLVLPNPFNDYGYAGGIWEFESIQEWPVSDWTMLTNGCNWDNEY